MHKLNIVFFLDYLFWHYTQAWRDLFRLFINFMWAVGNFFDFTDLITHLFSPFKRVFIAKEKGGDREIQSFFENLIANLLSRFVGALIRTALILFGLVGYFFVFLFFIVLFATWIMIPFIVIYLLFFGINYLIKGITLIL